MMLRKILDEIELATAFKPLLGSINGKKGIAYEWKITSDNGSIAKASLQVRVISTSNEEIDQLSKKIKKALITFGDGSPVPGVTSAFINGQSYLPIGDLNQIITNYQITYRSE